MSRTTVVDQFFSERFLQSSSVRSIYLTSGRKPFFYIQPIIIIELDLKIGYIIYLIESLLRLGDIEGAHKVVVNALDADQAKQKKTNRTRSGKISRSPRSE